ncbi:MAG: type II toxin-antitoxin system RelE family toxin [Enterococcus canintestini]|uniref:Plasmid stabilization protein n=1 Tax=Enterococcus canintestini TaxID=317010 RepID=A0A267HRU2_9ENTE|nr:type II toxin-antitoxin system RelE/ParE family toxin [Enterococcus canintestini]PAB01071.1 plasmid stabilization protein [Enterococcus canintestini]
MRKIIYSKLAAKFLKKQDKKTQLRIIQAISQIPKGDIKILHGQEPYKRLRVGNYRVVYTDDELVIHIVKIGNRGDVYK